MTDIPVSEMSDTELLRAIAADLIFLRSVIEPLLPLAEAVRGQNGSVDAVRVAGLRRALRKTGTR